MADFNKRTRTEMATNKPEIDARGKTPRPGVSWNNEDTYWREHFANRPYVTADRGYAFYQPAYRYGVESSFLYGKVPWNDRIESELALGWEQARGVSRATWDQVKDAVHEAWDRLLRLH